MWGIWKLCNDENFLQLTKMTICVHTAPVLKVAQLYRKLIASLIGITAEGIIILPKMNLIVVIAVKSGLTYYAASTKIKPFSIKQIKNPIPNLSSFCSLANSQASISLAYLNQDSGKINQCQRQKQTVKVKWTEDDHHYHPHKNWPGLKVGEEPGHLCVWVVFPLVRRKLLEF